MAQVELPQGQKSMREIGSRDDLKCRCAAFDSQTDGLMREGRSTLRIGCE